MRICNKCGKPMYLIDSKIVIGAIVACAVLPWIYVGVSNKMTYGYFWGNTLETSPSSMSTEDLIQWKTTNAIPGSVSQIDYGDYIEISWKEETYGKVHHYRIQK